MENNNKMDSECYQELYERIINSYEEENFELFKKLVDPISPPEHHEFMFMLLLEVFYKGLYDYRCSEYLIMLVAKELTDQEIMLFTICSDPDVIHCLYGALNLKFDDTHFNIFKFN